MLGTVYWTYALTLRTEYYKSYKLPMHFQQIKSIRFLLYRNKNLFFFDYILTQSQEKTKVILLGSLEL